MLRRFNNWLGEHIERRLDAVFYWLPTMMLVIIVGLVLVGVYAANAQNVVNVMNLPPGDSAAIVCYPEGGDGPTLAYQTDGKYATAVGSTLWAGTIGRPVKLADVWDATSHIGAISYGKNRLMYVLHIFDNKTKKKVARLFIDFQEPEVFLTGPVSNEWVYLTWECTHG